MLVVSSKHSRVSKGQQSAGVRCGRGGRRPGRAAPLGAVAALCACARRPRHAAQRSPAPCHALCLAPATAAAACGAHSWQTSRCAPLEGAATLAPAAEMARAQPAPAANGLQPASDPRAHLVTLARWEASGPAVAKSGQRVGGAGERVAGFRPSLGALASRSQPVAGRGSTPGVPAASAGARQAWKAPSPRRPRAPARLLIVQPAAAAPRCAQAEPLNHGTSAGSGGPVPAAVRRSGCGQPGQDHWCVLESEIQLNTLHIAAGQLGQVRALPAQTPRRCCLQRHHPPAPASAASAAEFLEVNAGDMQCMNALLARAGLAGALASDLPNTYFLPTDSAFLLDLGVRGGVPPCAAAALPAARCLCSCFVGCSSSARSRVLLRTHPRCCLRPRCHAANRAGAERHVHGRAARPDSA